MKIYKCIKSRNVEIQNRIFKLKVNDVVYENVVTKCFPELFMIIGEKKEIFAPFQEATETYFGSLNETVPVEELKENEEVLIDDSSDVKLKKKKGDENGV